MKPYPFLGREVLNHYRHRIRIHCGKDAEHRACVDQVFEGPGSAMTLTPDQDPAHFNWPSHDHICEIDWPDGDRSSIRSLAEIMIAHDAEVVVGKLPDGNLLLLTQREAA